MKDISQLLDLTGRTAIVTGGAKGIGYGIAYRLAEAGAQVLIADVDREAGSSAAKQLSEKGWVAEALAVDVADEQAVKAMIAVCLERFGSLDILVNNAGIYPQSPLDAMSAEEFDRVLAVNLRSVFLTTKYASEVMKAEGAGGRIVNITSIDALHPSMVGLAHYDASKHGEWGLTKSCALALAPFGITVNAIAPGGVVTPGVAAMSAGDVTQASPAAIEEFIARIPMRRMGDPDEIGMVALFLASDMSAYLTGSQIVVDGGRLLA